MAGKVHWIWLVGNGRHELLLEMKMPRGFLQGALGDTAKRDYCRWRLRHANSRPKISAAEMAMTNIALSTTIHTDIAPSWTSIAEITVAATNGKNIVSPWSDAGPRNAKAPMTIAAKGAFWVLRM